MDSQILFIGMERIGMFFKLLFLSLFLTINCFADVPGAVGDRAMTSFIASNMQKKASNNTNAWTGLAYGNSIYCAVSNTGTTTDRVMSSPNGETWTARTAAESRDWYSVAYGASVFVAVSYDADAGNEVMTSPDCVTWTGVDKDAMGLTYDITFGNSLFVAVGTSTVGTGIYSSPDGATWTQRTPPGSLSLSSDTPRVVWIPSPVSLFIIGTNIGYSGGSIGTSPDGINWTQRAASIGTSFSGTRGIAYGNSVVVAIGASGLVITSSDGLTWTQRAGITLVGSETITSLVHTGKYFVAYGRNLVAVSSDGVSWKKSAMGFDAAISRAIWSGQEIIGVSDLYNNIGSNGAFKSLSYKY